ncbi:hypothetical protein OHB26_20150 [Nocardia sp. NBC_01503]|uniref:hypothetical protein n=1 Tax=Nocardia sp. NBC_01503 TaxID=2975997 RepID=UPI002E7B86C4|nr:hypothetical protein [Nocardia sp. NBC_01503]WTL29326.1 hypothetical protein OHB26_20150 [Nocardia sp. NBC_01503]
MALHMSADGDWHIGDDPLDLDPYLRELGAEGYAIHEVRHSICENCGTDVFGVSGNPAEGTIRRECRGCGTAHFVADCGDDWNDGSTQPMVCDCDQRDFNIAVGYSLYAAGSGIRALATAERCLSCGRIESFTGWMVRGRDLRLLDLA